MKNLHVVAWTVAVAVAIVGSTAAWAGYKTSYSVTINNTTRTAEGAIGYARNSPDYKQSIGCEIYGTLTGNYVRCWAFDQFGASVNCQTANSNLLAVAMSLNGDDLLKFKWDVSGQCTEIHAYKMSYWEPKQP